jgi:K+-transporting ATPase ATPase C chain
VIRELRRAILFSVVTMALLGGLYPLTFRAVGRLLFPAQAEGSLIRRPDGSLVGSRLLAQKFARPEYFQPRPSGVDYNAAATGGTNDGPSNPDHLGAVRRRLEEIAAQEQVPAKSIPSEMVTASGSGLDPHIPPAAAVIQARRVAASRGVAVERIEERIVRHVEPPMFGVLGRAVVNVLELNLDLDATFGPPKTLPTGSPPPSGAAAVTPGGAP